jgi:hypothetical protein
MLDYALWLPWVTLALVLAAGIVLAVAFTVGGAAASARRAARRDVRLSHRSPSLAGGTGSPPAFRMVDGLEVSGEPALGRSYRGGTAARGSTAASAVSLRTEPSLGLRGATTVSGPGAAYVSQSGEVYFEQDAQHYLVGGKKVRARDVQLVDGGVSIVDGKCSAGGRLRGFKSHAGCAVVRAGDYVAYASGGSRVMVDRLTPEAGLVAAGSVRLPSGRTLAQPDDSGRAYAVSNNGLRLVVATSSSMVLSYARAAAGEAFRLTGAGSPMGEGVRRLEADPALSRAAVQVRTRVAGETTVLAYAWNSQDRMLGEVPQRVCTGRDQHLCELDEKKRITVYNGGDRGGLDVWQEA